MGFEPSPDSRFFVLEEAGVGSRYEAYIEKVEPINRGEAPRCSCCGDIIGLLVWHSPFRVKLELYGQECGDCIRGNGNEWLVSERFSHAFRAEGLTGLDGFHPVEVLQVRRMRKGPRTALPAPVYRVVWPCFGRAAVDLALNRVRVSAPPTCSECRVTGINATHGFVLEPNTWGGEDVFRPRGLVGDIVVSGRFKGFVERHGFTNMVLTPTEEYVWDPSGLGPAPAHG